MYIRKSKTTIKGKTYVNYVLVKSVMTPKGPRQRSICSLGNLKPRPAAEWLALAHKVEEALVGQLELTGPDPEVEGIVEKVRARQEEEKNEAKEAESLVWEVERGEREGEEVVSVVTSRVETQEVREAGAVNVGLHFYNLLNIDEILKSSGMSQPARLLTKVMTLNRLIEPKSEHAMPEWIRRTCLADVLGEEVNDLKDDALYKNLDRLHEKREGLERALAQREKSLFNLDDTIYLYDLTSTYFEGTCPHNPKAKRGYSRDKRPDCKQVVVGLVVDGDGFPKAHEVFDGNRTDSTTVKEMLACLQRRVGKDRKGMVVVDRGMAFDANLEDIVGQGYDYLVASRQNERDALLAEFESEKGWSEAIRTPSPTNPAQKKTKVEIRRFEREGETLALCISEGRKAKDRAIREKQDKRLLADLNKLSESVKQGRLKNPKKIWERIGRLKERYSRVARYYEISYDEDSGQVIWSEDQTRKEKAERLDGSYVLKTNRQELSEAEIWRTYSLLTRVENAFRNLKSPLSERPIYHQLPHRVESHIFLCVLAYHLLVSIEKTLLDQELHTSWATVRETVSTHHVITVVLPTSSGDVLHIRKPSTPDKDTAELYRLLGVPSNFMKAVRTWVRKQTSPATPI
jgi:transposase